MASATAGGFSQVPPHLRGGAGAAQGIIELCTPLKVAYDEDSSEVSLTPTGGPARTTLTLTLSGSVAFCDAFRERFEFSD